MILLPKPGEAIRANNAFWHWRPSKALYRVFFYFLHTLIFEITTISLTIEIYHISSFINILLSLYFAPSIFCFTYQEYRKKKTTQNYIIHHPLCYNLREHSGLTFVSIFFLYSILSVMSFHHEDYLKVFIYKFNIYFIFSSLYIILYYLLFIIIFNLKKKNIYWHVLMSILHL